MNGAIPHLHLYAFMAWTGKNLSYFNPFAIFTTFDTHKLSAAAKDQYMYPTGGKISLKNEKDYYNAFSVLCRCNPSAAFRVSRFGIVFLAKHLLPAASNSTLKVLQTDVEFTGVYDSALFGIAQSV